MFLSLSQTESPTMPLPLIPIAAGILKFALPSIIAAAPDLAKIFQGNDESLVGWNPAKAARVVGALNAQDVVERRP